MDELHGLFLDFDFGYANNNEDRLWDGVCVSQAKEKEEQQLISFL